MKVIDVRGKNCPMPLIETKKVLTECKKDEIIKVVFDNETSVNNVTRFLEDNGIKLKQRKTGNNFELLFKKDGGEFIVEDAKDYCENLDLTKEKFIVVFGKDRLGEGSEDLGNMLVGGMLTTFVETGRMPDKIIFMNSGINLVLENSPVLQLLKKLESEGCELLSCGACLDYFGKMEQLRTGRVSNMMEILEIMTIYSRVINI